MSVPGANIAFVTSSQQPIAPGGLANADAICQAHADGAGLAGTYLAFLSPDGGKAHDRIAAARGWVRTDGLPALDFGYEFFTGQQRRPIFLDERGNPTTGWAATGTDTNGDGVVGDTCASYTSATGTTWWGDVDGIWTAATTTIRAQCSTPTRLYCFGIDRVTPLPLEPQTAGRAMFIYPGGASSGGGLAAFDSLCASAAVALGLPGTFLALVATPTMAASARFPSGAPWVRADGVALSSNWSTLIDGSPLLATPTSNPALTTIPIFTGAPAPNMPGTLGSTCQDWTSQSGADSVTVGNALHVGPRWFNDGLATVNCSSDLPVYCLQQ